MKTIVILIVIVALWCVVHERFQPTPEMGVELDERATSEE